MRRESREGGRALTHWAPAALNTALAHKLKKVMETRTESPDMMVALQVRCAVHPG